MGFRRKKVRAERVALDSLDATEIERRIIEGVRRYATQEDSWREADRNTPFLGRITGLGIESSNLADITLSIERQFDTRMTRRVRDEDGTLRLEPGEPGPLRILTGQDATMATPGLAIVKLAELGHLTVDASYISQVVTFGYITILGDGYRLDSELRKAYEIGGGDNIERLVEQAEDFLALLLDPAALAEERRGRAVTQRTEHEELLQALEDVERQLEASTAEGDEERVPHLRGEQAELKTRARHSERTLRVAEEVAEGLAHPSEVELEAIRTLTDRLRQTMEESRQAASVG